MSANNRNDLWHEVMTKWLTGAIYAPIRIIGSRQVKVMTRGMSLVLVNSLIKEMTASGKITLGDSTDDNKALEIFRTMESEWGIAEKATNIEIDPKDDGSVSMVFHKCPYGKLCNEALSELLSRGDFNKATIPCLRMETYSACVGLLARSKRGYRLIQFAPGAKCQGEIVPPRTSPSRG